MTGTKSIVQGAWALGLCGLMSLGGCDDNKSETVAQDDEIVEGAPTWHQDVAPLVSEKCGSCHVEGGIAPFALSTYAQAKQWAPLIAESVESGRMPPFLAQETDDCQPKLPWRDDLRLSAEQKETIRAWADAKAPEGNADEAAEKKVPPAVALEREDIVLEWPEELTVEGDKDLHVCIIVDPKLTKDEYITGRLITAGNPKVLHHVVSYLITPSVVDEATGQLQTKAELEAALMAEKGVGINGSYDCFGGPGLTTVTTEMLDAWAPGGIANTSPENAGQPVDKDALVLLDVHYHPLGAPEKDRSKLALMLADSVPQYVARTILLGNFQGTLDTEFGVGQLMTQPDESAPAFMIPPGAESHFEDMSWTWKLPIGPIRVFAMGTHMHYVGRKMRVTLESGADATQNQCLIETPSYDFNWQRGYGYQGGFEDFPVMSNGDVLKFHCEFNNSMSNRFVVQALEDQGYSEPVEVRLGEDTLDEMCLAAVGIMYQNFAP